MTPHVGVGGGQETRYYTKLNRATDFLLRCKDCRALVTHATIQKYAGCTCGNKKLQEITTLTEAEMASLTDGTIDFPYKAEFLAEFSAHE